MTLSPLAPDVKLTPYWLDGVAPPTLPPADLPKETDVVVIGSGYTGLHAALQTARAGRATLVVDAKEVGWGCSTRNGGQISTSVKPSYAELTRRHGPELAARNHQGRAALTQLDRRVHRF